MAPERQVGFVQYELKIRGAKQLNAASSAQVKGKSIKLTERKYVPKEYKKMARPGGAKMMVLEDWEKKKLELQRKGMGQKEDENLATEKSEWRIWHFLIVLMGRLQTKMMLRSM